MVATGTRKLCCSGFWFELLNSCEQFTAIMALLFSLQKVAFFHLLASVCAIIGEI